MKSACKQIGIDHDIVKHFPIDIQKHLPKEIASIEVSSAKSQQLNWTYRKKRTPANVLSFFYSLEYGEIIVCPVLIRAEAKRQGNSFQYQMTWMIVHGMLHLAGVHHEASANKAERRFEQIERRVLQKFKKHNTLLST